ncbi:hypothetical protein F8388_004595 [Cannabis sativa]|uniref:RanBP2-type domain-containing protein n=1 Tax=Cannabis sativa TaxID=3483 RepID=A0A7J6FFC7_CANSA|nr:hypothetical protein G4B88_023807 [Cannabis sativa]KAF4377765.1 hypothetical protein F8388_011518 [Cannabis sativa]KAF4384362.1 hypothetical protein F8388_004595 [Cannabis sativa]
MSWTGSGDWMCGACQHVNFKKRDQCQRCQYPKYGGPDPSTYCYNNRTEVLAGDWFCNCGSHNYASRSQCFRCGSIKNDYGGGYGAQMMTAYGSDNSSAPPGWKSELDVENTIMLAGRFAINAKRKGIMVVKYKRKDYFEEGLLKLQCQMLLFLFSL